MFAVAINWWAILACAVVNMILGFLWFGPVFGKIWMASAGIQKPEVVTPEMKKEMNKNYAIMFVGSVVMAIALVHNITFGSAYLHVYGVSAGLQAGFWNWLGFVAPVTVGVVLWDRKSWKYWAVTYGYYLVSMLVMGAILAGW